MVYYDDWGVGVGLWHSHAISQIADHDGSQMLIILRIEVAADEMEVFSN